MASGTLYGFSKRAEGNSVSPVADDGSLAGSSGDTDQSSGVDPRTLETSGGDGGSGNSGGNTGGNTGTGSKRGRKPGTAQRAKNNSVKDAGKACEVMLAGIHQLLAMSLEVPELALEESEAATLGAAIAHVQSFYPNTVLDPKVAAWAALAVTVAKIEGPRAFLVAQKLREKAAQKKGGENSNA